MLNRKAEENVSQYILIVGVVVIVSLMVLFASSMLQGIDLPEGQTQKLEGTETEIANKIAVLLDRCWEMSNKGRMNENMGCYLIHIEGPEEDIGIEEVKRRLEMLSEENLNVLSEVYIKDGETLVMSYYHEGYSDDDDKIVLR